MIPDTVTCSKNTAFRSPSGVYSTAHGSIRPRRARTANVVTSWGKVRLGSGDSGGRVESHGRNHDPERCRIRAQSASSRPTQGTQRDRPVTQPHHREEPAIGVRQSSSQQATSVFAATGSVPAGMTTRALAWASSAAPGRSPRTGTTRPGER